MDSATHIARRLLASLPSRPITLDDLMGLQADNGLESLPRVDEPPLETQSEEDNPLLNVGGVVAREEEDWFYENTIIGFRFVCGKKWFGVGFEPPTGWTILSETPIHNVFSQAIDDRVAEWATTFYDASIIRPSFFDCFAGYCVRQLPTRPLEHGELAQILFPGGIYQDSYVEVTAIPIIQIQHTDKIVVFLMKLTAPDRTARIVEYGYVLDTDGIWKQVWIDSVPGKNGTDLGLRDRPVAVLLENAQFDYMGEIDLLVPPPADHIQIEVYRNRMSPEPIPGGMWTDAPVWFPSITHGAPAVGLNTDDNPGEKTVLGYLSGEDTGVYIGLNRLEDSWDELFSFDIPVDPSLNRQIEARLDGWLQSQYGTLADSSPPPLVQLETWDSDIPDLFASM